MGPLDRQTVSRRTLLAAPALLTAGCQAAADTGAPPRSIPPLKQVAPFPLGVCAMTGEFGDADFVSTLAANFSQLTPEWEMKMEAIVKPDGSLDFTRPDAVAAFAAEHGLRLHGHTLAWYAEEPEAFRRIEGTGKTFADAYRSYILQVAGRYRGKVASWDVLNEPVMEEGEGLRDCLWSRNLGPDYGAIAFHCARAADPDAILFMNDYFLDTKPKKRATYLRLAEHLLKTGAPLGGLATQTHVSIAMTPGAIRDAIRDLARFGLPIHVSEMDVSTRGGPLDIAAPAQRREVQARIYAEAMEAFLELPERQRFAFTIWGVRDRDSWLRRPPNAGDGSDRPLVFDDQGRPKPAAAALVDVLTRRAGRR